MSTMKMALSVEHLNVSFETRSGRVQGLSDVSFTLARGEMLGLVGESGSGKSVASLAIMGLSEPSATLSGKILHEGRDLLAERGPRRADVPRHFAMIFQYPRTALNPIRRVGDQLADVLLAHAAASRAEARRRALELLEEVRIARAAERLAAYPFELSGGMCQRVLIALALAQSPSVLIADEPTTGLDVVTQDAVMGLLEDARRRRGMAVILITHDLGLACRHCQRLVVLQRGRVVEEGTPHALFTAARHPYTRLLVGATPGLAMSLADLDAATRDQTEAAVTGVCP
jgi:peptide/nickel transport system ATP-binding protein